MSIDYSEMKKHGFLQQRQKDTFIARYRGLAGNLTSQELRQLADLADKYGKGYVHLTTRQGMEIPWVALNTSVKMKEEAQALGLNTGASGPRIRTIVSCPGKEVCKFGLMDSRSTALILDNLIFGRSVPTKVKVAVSGCPNSCAKPQENDIGFKGIVEPVLDAAKCTGCGACEKVCPNAAITMVDDRPVVKKSGCLLDGKCISSCPADAWQAKRSGYMLYVGGKIGRKPKLGQAIAKFIHEEQAAEAVEAVLAAFETLGKPKERIADTISRVGVDVFKEEMKWTGSRQLAVGS